MQIKTKDKSKKQSFSGCFFFFKNNIFLLLGICIAVSLCMYGIIGIFGFSAFPDEFGYWSVAAAILGYDWSQITGLGPYYSYGYGILLAPVLFLFHDPIITYRMAVILNLIFQIAAFPLLYQILKELFSDVKKNALMIATSVAALYPAWCFYTQTTMTEAFLYFGFILMIYLMLRFLKKPAVSTGIALILLSVYLYLVHMRCIGIIGALVITFLIRLTLGNRTGEKKLKKFWMILILVIFLFAGTFILKDRVVAFLYHNTSDHMMSWNDYSGLAYRIGKILKLQGLVFLLKDFCGKALYLGLATYGIAYYGICLIVKRALFGFKAIRQKNSDWVDYLWIYICFAVIFEFLVALIFLNGASAPWEDRLDNFLHGRYVDFFLPILIATGLLEMTEGKRPFLKLTIVLLTYLVFGAVALQAIRTNDVQMNNPHGFTMIGMSYLLEKPLIDTTAFFLKETALSVGLTLLVFVLTYIAWKKKLEMLLSLVLLVQIALGINACDHFIFPYQPNSYLDLTMGEKIREIHDEFPYKNVVHLYEGGNPYIETVQFANRDLPITVVDVTTGVDVAEALTGDIILVAPRESGFEGDIEKIYKEKWEVGHFDLYYNP